MPSEIRYKTLIESPMPHEEIEDGYIYVQHYFYDAINDEIVIEWVKEEIREGL